jgi:hypothetical protein
VSKRTTTKINAEIRYTRAARNRHEVWHSPHDEHSEPIGEWEFISARASFEAVNKYPPLEFS